MPLNRLNPQAYNDPHNGKPSSNGQAIIDAYMEGHYRKTIPNHTYFTKLASTTELPEYNGKNLILTVDLPLLSDLNLNNQGINRRGVAVRNGNLYGESDSFDVIGGAMPYLGEFAGRKNRVGFMKYTVTATVTKQGIFFEYTEDLIRFSPEGQTFLRQWTGKAVDAIVNAYEKYVQLEVLTNVGTAIFPGVATRLSEMGTKSLVSMVELNLLEDIFDVMQVPKTTEILNGSDYTDTVTLDACRILLVPPRIRRLFETFRDSYGEPAWIPFRKYGSQTKQIAGEIGSIGAFRVVEVPQMPVYRGRGRRVDQTTNYEQSYGHLDVFPLICIGPDAFATINVRTNSWKNKISSGSFGAGLSRVIRVTSKEPGTGSPEYDPYDTVGRKAFMWDTGFMTIRRHRIACIYTTLPKNLY